MYAYPSLQFNISMIGIRPNIRSSQKRGFSLLLPFLVFCLLWSTLCPPAWCDVTVNDITQLNPIIVDKVITPTTVEDVVIAIKNHAGPISISGGRFSMGGQTATEHCLQIDMREMNKVLAFSKAAKTITVQSGITWRKVQEYIDPDDLSLQIMQSYANFTVGGSLSVNVHGRYVGQGPIVLSVNAIKIVLANGDVVNASPTENSAIFYGAIGGYGGLGVIVEATLALTDNIKVKRQSQLMSLKDYPAYFSNQVRGNSDIIFHNANLYPDGYDTIRAISYRKTDEAVTLTERLAPLDKNYRFNRLLLNVISEWPFGKYVRERVIEPTMLSGEPVVWRNYEASYSVDELEPSSREASTYVLQEYFVPAENFIPFISAMTRILQEYKVNVINISIRHAHKDPGTLLAWAKNDVFSFVLYYKQGVSKADQEAVGYWTRALIDKAIEENGSFYLPYQIHATKKQFENAYPNAKMFFALKTQLDPTNKFRNKLWDVYYQPPPH